MNPIALIVTGLLAMQQNAPKPKQDIPINWGPLISAGQIWTPPVPTASWDYKEEKGRMIWTLETDKTWICQIMHNGISEGIRTLEPTAITVMCVRPTPKYNQHFEMRERSNP